VQDALRNADISHLVQLAMSSIQEAAGEHARPSAVYRPELTRDGNMFCAIYGPNLHEGVAGFGETPDLAMRNFDANWYKRVPSSSSEMRHVPITAQANMPTIQPPTKGDN
jgi:hypothetical protein